MKPIHFSWFSDYLLNTQLTKRLMQMIPSLQTRHENREIYQYLYTYTYNIKKNFRLVLILYTNIENRKKKKNQ